MRMVDISTYGKALFFLDFKLEIFFKNNFTNIILFYLAVDA